MLVSKVALALYLLGLAEDAVTEARPATPKAVINRDAAEPAAEPQAPDVLTTDELDTAPAVGAIQHDPPKVVIPDIRQELRLKAGGKDQDTSAPTVSPRELFARAPPVYRLRQPSDYGSQDEFTLSESDRFDTQPINIFPSTMQLLNFRKRVSTSVRHPVPIGATGQFWRWPKDRPQTWTMFGLKGCTAMFAVSKHGLWAGHEWEMSGGNRRDGTDHGSFNYYPDKLSERRNKFKQRPDEEFKVVGADILGEETSTNRANTWISFPDLMKLDPKAFPDGGKYAHVHILTVAKRMQNPQPYYDRKINLLQAGFRAPSALPNAALSVSTYVRHDDPLYVPKVSTGIVIIQYTPNNGDGYAEVKLWVEDETHPRIWMSWTKKKWWKGSNSDPFDNN